MDTLEQFIQSNPDPRELKRALAVQMSQRGHSYREIRSGTSSFNRICYCLPSTLQGSGSGGTEIELLGHSRVPGHPTEAGVVRLVGD